MRAAAAPMKPTESTRPRTRIQGWSWAAAATASTLSRDIEMSAIMICVSACPRVFVDFRGPRSGILGQRAEIRGRQDLGDLFLELPDGGVLAPLVAQLAPQLPAHPQQQQAADEAQAEIGEHLGCRQREDHRAGRWRRRGRRSSPCRAAPPAGRLAAIAHNDGVVPDSTRLTMTTSASSVSSVR